MALFTKNSEDKNVGYNTTIISNGIICNGDIIALHNVRLDGKMTGSIVNKSKVIIGTTGILHGDITAQDAEISGFFEGKLEIIGLLIVRSTAVIKGSIIANKLLFEDGAKFEGTCSMSNVKGDKIKNISNVEQISSTSEDKKMSLNNGAGNKNKN